MMPVAPTTEADAYAEHEPAIRAIARRFASQFNWDPDEAESEANLQFLEAYRTWDPSRGDLGARVSFCVRTRLLSLVRDRARKHASLPRTTAVLETVSSHRWTGEPSDVAGIVHGMSRDAETVVTILWGDDENEFNRTVRAESRPSAHKVRVALERYLRKVVGWTRDRVADAFDEIHDHICLVK